MINTSNANLLKEGQFQLNQDLEPQLPDPGCRARKFSIRYTLRT